MAFGEPAIRGTTGQIWGIKPPPPQMPIHPGAASFRFGVRSLWMN